MTYKEALEYLDSFIDYEKMSFFDYKESLRLERMQRFSEKLGNPHSDLRCIHIAGTKGKGSTAAMVASILKKAGYKTGLYTSPHLVSFRERIKINDEPISESELSGFIERMKPVLEETDNKSDECPTFFEICTALAFLYFKEKKADFCVLEVGIGGRLDATNIINPSCCGITQISLEHTQKLGNTLEKIAREKAGIIKKDSICVSSLQDDSARGVIRKTCEDKQCRVYEVGRDLHFDQDPGRAVFEGKQSFSVKGVFQEYPDLELNLLGHHQLMNAATAIGLIESLRFYDIIVRYNAVKDGLRNVNWPGRLQVIRNNPYVVLDGAQNRASARALKEAVKKIFDYNKMILVLGISKDKDKKAICEELASISDSIILTKAKSPRAEEPMAIKQYFKKDARCTTSVEEAMHVAEGMAKVPDLILVTGSLFVVGEVLEKNSTKELSYA